MKNRQRILAYALCLIMLVCSILCLASCGECEHDFGAWRIVTDETCTEAGVMERYCLECGITETAPIEPLGHYWTDATCTTPKTCLRCSATDGEALGHVFTKEIESGSALKSAATCEAAATYYKSCFCGAISSDDEDTFTVGEALGHIDENTDHECDRNCGKNDMGEHTDSDDDDDKLCDYGCGVAIGIPCTDAEGDGDHNCDDCGEPNVSGHKFGNATCTSPKTCSECGATEGSALDHIDENKDHVCDRECGKSDIGAHADSATDDDHVCDYGCGASLEACSDAANDGDHSCDICDKANVTGHTYGNADCNNPATCSDCGETSGSAIGHIDENTDHICDRGCGKNDIGAHADSATDDDHLCDYGCGASCGEVCSDAARDGDHKCDVCGEDEKSEHTFGSATCANASTCSECGATNGDPLPHTYDQEVIKTEALLSAADCDSPAVYHKSCSCGAISDSETEYLFESGTALGHSFVVETVSDDAKISDATCTRPAVYHLSCACGEISDKDSEFFEYGNTVPHTYDKEIVNSDTLCEEAGCENAAKYFKSCECGAISENVSETFESGSAAGHSYQLINHTDADCDNAARNYYYCYGCGDSYDEVDDTVNNGNPLGHTIDGVTPVRVDISECEYVQKYICARGNCNHVVKETTVPNHTYAATVKNEATCAAPGLKTFRCTKCGDTSKPSEEIPNTDEFGNPLNLHVWVIGTDTEDGIRTDECSVCHQTKEVTVYTGEAVKGDDLADKEIGVGDANITLDSGVANGIGDKDVTISADKLGEDDKENLGLSDEQLNQVGDNPIYNFTIYDTEADKNISDFGEDNYITITLPYTLKDGEDADSIAIWFISDKCRVENCENGEGCDDPDHKLESIDATYNNGFVTFKTNHFSYYTVTRLTPKERCQLHGHVDSYTTVEGSCTTDGYTLWVCLRCHESETQNVIPAPGHSYEATDTVNATCTTNGYITYTCQNGDCGHSYQTRIKATGHSFAINPDESFEASCTVNGQTKYECENENCDVSYTETYAKAGHNYIDNTVPADCENAGYTTHTCQNEGCTYSYTDSYVAALGHAYESIVWIWEDDFSAASVTLTCENDEEHIVTLDATIGITVVNGTCSSFVKTTYRAAVAFGGEIYADEKTTEEGTPDHSFSANYKTDDEYHWRECICGEKTDYAPHAYENTTVKVEPTCSEAGESESYCVCGKIHTEAIPATGEHTYEDGICTECGEEESNNYYLGLAESFKNIDGFAIKLNNLTLNVNEKTSSLLSELKLIGSIKKLEICELMLYVEDGELHGALIGTIEVFNGPIPDANAIFAIEAIIQDGYLYATLTQGAYENPQVMNIKMSVEAILSQLANEMDINEQVITLFTFLGDTVLPAIDTLVQLNADELNAILEDLYNMIFSFEKLEDGKYVAVLDFDKISALNENLATLTVADLMDLYFGEGALDSIKNLVYEILDLKIPEIPGYVDELGLDSADIIAKINELMVALGAADEGEFDINEFINSPDFADVTLGMLMLNAPSSEDYHKMIDEDIIKMLTETSLYDLISEGQGENIKKNVDSVITMLTESISLSFTTAADGMLLDINISISEFGFDVNQYQSIELNLDLDIIINGRIDVSFDDIIERIEAGIVLPDEEDMPGTQYDAEQYTCSGTVKYDGKEYYYERGSMLELYKYDYSDPFGVYYFEDCVDWTYYSLGFKTQKAMLVSIMLTTDDGRNVMLLLNSYTGEVVELLMTQTGYKAVYADGTTKDIEIPTDGMTSEIQLYVLLCEGVFGSDIYADDYYRSEELDYYYNATTKEFSGNSHHELEYVYEFNGESHECEDGYTATISCSKCDYYESFSATGHRIEGETHIELPGECGSSITYERCAICEKIVGIYDQHYNCHFEEMFKEEILDENGNHIGNRTIETCTNCGLQFVEENYVEIESSCISTEYNRFYILNGDEYIIEYLNDYRNENHQYEYTYTLEGDGCDSGYHAEGYCSVCGDFDEFYGGGHRYDYRNIDLKEYGLCGGYISEQYCEICNTVISCNIEEYCYWENMGIDENGYTVYSCKICGTEKLTSSRENQVTSCRYEIIHEYIYLKNGEEIFSTTSRSFTERHKYYYEYEMKGSSCLDGVITRTHCENCDISWMSSYNSHVMNTIFNATSYEGCCGNHNVIVYACPCGEKYSTSIDTSSFMYDVESKMYFCENCDLTVQNSTEVITNGCSVTTTTRILVMLGDETLYINEYSDTQTNHNFGNPKLETIDGIIYITSVCDKCQSEKNSNVMTADTQMSENKMFYYDFVFTPEVSGKYTIVSLINEDTYVELYNQYFNHIAENDDGGYNSNFSLTYNLNAGETYTYRIGSYGYDEPITVMFSISMTDEQSASSCDHERKEEMERGNTNFSVLCEGSMTCEDGVISGRLCNKCGDLMTVGVYNEHRGNTDYTYLYDYKTCWGGSVYYEYCACGEYTDIYTTCAYEYTENYHIDEETGREVHVEAWHCNNCGLRIESHSYSTEAVDCYSTTNTSITVTINGELISFKEYEKRIPAHSYSTSFNLLGDDCEDGVEITYTCSECSYSFTKTTHSHTRFPKETVKLDEKGSVCGGSVTLSGCACGKYNELSLDKCGCDLDSYWIEVWIEDYITEDQYNIEGWVSPYNTSSSIFTCAVTDPEQCAYKIRYAQYWLKADNECYMEQWQTWQFGYNEESGEYEYEVTFKTGNKYLYHDYINSSEGHNTKYDCEDCGSYYYANTYYDDNGRLLKTETIYSNTLDNGLHKFRENIVEYGYILRGEEENVYHEQYTSREYYRTVYADGTEWWSEALIERNNYSADFGKFGIVYGYEELHTRSDSSGWFESDSHAKVYLKGHEFTIYDERSGNGWLERYDYTYDFDGECCMATEVYTRSNDKYEDGKPEEGKSHERTYCCCRFSEYTTIEMPTCTQDGYAAVKCAICGKEDGKNTIPANRHNWIPLNEKWYYCFSCGLENTNGADGDIVLEDLTDKYGNGESYVVGYYDQNGKIEFYTLVSLVDKNGEFLSDIFPKIEEVNGLRAYAVSIAEIKTIAAELGITDYDVRFSFVPTYGDGMFDYAITFTENLTPGAITGSTNFVDYISKEETKVYTITPSKDGVWVFISITNGDTHATLFDSEGNLLELSDDDYDNDFRIEIKLLAGETYYLNVRWYTFYEGGDGANMALSFTFNANDNGDDEGKTENGDDEGKTENGDDEGKTENGDVEYPEEKVEGDEIVVVPEEKFEGKYVEVIG